MNAAERKELRLRVSEARKIRLGLVRPVSSVSTRPAVIRKIEKARRAQEAQRLVSVLIPPTPATSGRCGFCGARTAADVCPAHADLVGLS